MNSGEKEMKVLLVPVAMPSLAFRKSKSLDDSCSVTSRPSIGGLVPPVRFS